MGGVVDDEPPSKRMKASSGELGLSNGQFLKESTSCSFRDSMARPLNSEGDDKVIGLKGVKKVEFVRIKAEALYSLGYKKAGALLEEESDHSRRRRRESTESRIGSRKVTVYQCLEGGVIAVLQSYVDDDKDESFYTVSWACDVDGTPLLVAGGLNGIMRVIDAGNEKIHKSFVGHGDSINEIRTQPLKPSLVLSASKDESVRLWNVHTGICILIFAGAGGHRNEVLSVDFHPSDIYRIASCGMDNTVKIWSMKEFWTYVEKSFTWTDLPSKFPTKYVQFPVLISCIHSNYVDCNRWLGDFMLSKSVDNEIVLWEPKMKEQSPGEGSVDILQKYPVPECDIWFIKFSYDFHYNAAAIGNREGKIFVWELQSSPPVLIARLSHVQSKSPIRQTAMSVDGSTILSCCEDGTIWRWDTVATS